MYTLLLRLEGPMQSWGMSSRFTERDTGMEPTKSGVIGLVCAALGKPRHEAPEHIGRWPLLSDLASLRMGVRVDRPGTVGVDFQTAGGGKMGRSPYGVARVQGGLFGSVMSWRYYLQDASFLVGLSGTDLSLLETLHEALRRPVWQIYLGRKSYLPSTPPYLPDGMMDTDLTDALICYPSSLGECVDERSRVVLEIPYESGAEPRMDQPVDFSRRRFSRRYVRVLTVAELREMTGGDR